MAVDETRSLPSLSTQMLPPAPRVADLERLGDEIAELSAHLEVAGARLLDLIRKFDAAGGWSHGFRSCAHWLNWRVGLDMGAARERVRVARALETLPRLGQALAGGELSYAKVRALTRVATPETEERLLAVGKAGTAEHVERVVRGWRHVDAKAELRESRRQHRQREFRVYDDDGGMVVVRGRLEPEVGALLRRALEAAREVAYQKARREDADAADAPTAKTAPAGPSAASSGDAPLDRPTMGQQQADALVLLLESALHQLDPGAPGERYQVVVHVDAAALAEPGQAGQPGPYEPGELEGPRRWEQSGPSELPGQPVLEDGAHVPAGTSKSESPGRSAQSDGPSVLPVPRPSAFPGESVLEDGARVPPETARRLACDASRVVMRHDDAGRVVEIGARTRTIPPALRRALQQRDRGCRFPGCGVRVGQGHHLHHWAHGGSTTLTNLALLCRAHHRAVHEEGYRVGRLADGGLRFWRPDGRELPEVPAPSAVPANPVDALRTTNAAQGLRIHARTGCPGWQGESLDVGWAIDVLHPLANPTTRSWV